MKISTLFLMLGMFTGGMYTQTVGGLTQAQKDVLNTLQVVYLNDCTGAPTLKTLRVKDANLQVVNGTGNTDGHNGLGNIIVGYNEPGVQCDRRGSHNIIVGTAINYHDNSNVLIGNDIQSNGVFGLLHGAAISTNQTAYHAAIAGEAASLAGNNSVILSGTSNAVTNAYSISIGGEMNNSNDEFSLILGGMNNTISQSPRGILVGGLSNFIDTSDVGDLNIVIGGQNNHIDPGAYLSTITGGSNNHISGTACVVSGGNTRTASGTDDWVAGSLFEDN